MWRNQSPRVLQVAMENGVAILEKSEGVIELRSPGSSCCSAAETNPTSIHEDTGSIPGLAQ